MPLVVEALGRALEPLVPHSALKSMVKTLEVAAQAEVGSLDVVAARRLLEQVSVGLRLYSGQITSRSQLDALRRVVTGGRHPAPTAVKVSIIGETDVLVAVKSCQRLCTGFFSGTDTVRLATVVSEFARNTYMYAGRGSIELTLSEDERGVWLTINALDSGPGFSVEKVMSESYVSKTGLGRGLKGCRSILDSLVVESAPGRTHIEGTKRVRQ